MLRHKQKHFIKTLLVGLVLLMSLGFFNTGIVVPATASAAPYKCDPQKAACCQEAENSKKVEACKKHPVMDNPSKATTPEVGRCYIVKNNPVYGPLYYNSNCADSPFNAYQKANIDCDAKDLDDQNCKILLYLRIFINILSAMVGIVITAVIVIAGIQYSSAGNDPQKISSARNRIVNALLALVTFIFMYAFLQWIVPGGIF